MTTTSPDEQIVRAFAPEPEPVAEVTGPDPAEEAYARGLDEGREQARKEHEAKLTDAIREMAQVERKILAGCESRMIELALEAASRIVRERIETGDPVAERAVREAVDAAPSGQPLDVRIHPEDASAIRDSLAAETGEGRVKIVEDAAITRGGCHVDSPAGGIDGTLETAIDAVTDAVRG